MVNKNEQNNPVPGQINTPNRQQKPTQHTHSKMLRAGSNSALLRASLRCQSTTTAKYTPTTAKYTPTLNQVIIKQIQTGQQKPINEIVNTLNEKLSKSSATGQVPKERFYSNDFFTNKNISELISRSKYDYKMYLQNKYSFANDVPPTPYELFTKLDNLNLIQPYHYTLLIKYYYDEKNFKELLSFYVNNSNKKEVFDKLRHNNKRESNTLRDMIIISYLQTCSSKENVDFNILLKFLNNNFLQIDHATFRSLVEMFYYKGSVKKDPLDTQSMSKFHEFYKQFMDTQSKARFAKSIPPNRTGLSYLIDLKNHYLPYVYQKNKTPKLSWIMDSMMDHYSYKLFTELYKQYPNDCYSNRSLLYALGKNTQDPKEVRSQRIQAVWNTFFVPRTDPPLCKDDYLAMLRALGELDYENKLEHFFKNSVDIPASLRKDVQLENCYHFYLLNYDGKSNFHSLKQMEEIEKTIGTKSQQSLEFVHSHLKELTEVSNDEHLQKLVLILGMRLVEQKSFDKEMEMNSKGSDGKLLQILQALGLENVEKSLIVYNKLLNSENLQDKSLMIEESHFDFAQISSYTKNIKFYENLLRYLPNNYNNPTNYLMNIIETCVIQLCRRNEEDLAVELFKLNYQKFINLANAKNTKNVSRDIKTLINAMVQGLSKNLKYCSPNDPAHISKCLKSLDEFMFLYLKSFEVLFENQQTNTQTQNPRKNGVFLDDRSMKQILMAVVDLKFGKLSHKDKQLLKTFIDHYNQYKDIYDKNLTSVEKAKIENLITKLVV